MKSEKNMFINRWETFYKGLGKLAELMDEKDYDFKPTPEIFSFKELLFHIINSEVSFTDMIQNGTWTRNKYPAENYKIKQDIVDLLKKVHSQSLKIIQEMTDDQMKKVIKTPWGVELTAIGLLWGMRDHMIHHRGQLFIYVRLKGIKPPPFVEN